MMDDDHETAVDEFVVDVHRKWGAFADVHTLGAGHTTSPVDQPFAYFACCLHPCDRQAFLV